MELKDTVDLMNSEDYKDRFKFEIYTKTILVKSYRKRKIFCGAMFEEA